MSPLKLRQPSGLDAPSAHSLARRQWLLVASSALTGLLLGAGVAGCDRTPRRERILASVIQAIVVPDLRVLVAESRALERELKAVVQFGAGRDLAPAQTQWRKTVLAWKRAACFRQGPLVDTSALFRVLFWPCKAPAIDALVAGDSALTFERVSEFGVDEKGLFALEHLLFGPKPTRPSSPVHALGNSRARALAGFYAQHIAECAGQIEAELHAGKPDARAFAAAGQESLNFLVNLMVESIETLPMSHISASADAISFELTAAVLAWNQRCFIGPQAGGLSDLVKAVAPLIDRQIRGAFAQAISAIQRPSQARAFQNEQATRAVKELELLLKVDMASALGVSVIFTGADSD